MKKYLNYHLVGYLDNRGVYEPDKPATNRSLSIEEYNDVLHAMDKDDLVAWKRHQQDLVMTRKLEEERERAEQIVEGWCSEVGHGLSAGRPHMPTVDGVVI